jgi:iduronate 2-sulfatase
VLRALDGAGLRSSTLCVLLGDHGWQLSERGEWAKFSNADVATRVPLLVRPAGVAAAPPRYSHALVELVDLWPSLAELAGVPQPPLCGPEGGAQRTCVEGSSWAAHARPSPPAREPPSKPAVFSQYPRPATSPRGPDDGNTDLPSLVNITVMGYSMRTAPARRYTEWVGFRGSYAANGTILTTGPLWDTVHARELYDLEDDPLELRNLADEPARAAEVAVLARQLRRGWRGALVA